MNSLTVVRMVRIDRPGAIELFDAQLGRETLGVIAPGHLGPVGHALADGDDDQLHPRRLGAALLFFAGAFLAGALVACLAGVFAPVDFFAVALLGALAGAVFRA